jgi:hypothetical protein
MKKTKILAITALFLFLISTCHKTEVELYDTLPLSVNVEKNGLTGSVLPQVELISLVQYLGNNLMVNYGMIGRFFTDYRLAIDQHFRAYDQHPAVLFYDNMEFPYFDEPATWALLLKPDFTVDREAFQHFIEKSSDRAFATVDEMQDFFDLLKDFAVTSGFNGFFTSQEGYYRTIVHNTVALLPEENILGRMEYFYGHHMGSYNVVLTQYLGGFGPEVQKQGERHIYALIGPTGTAGRMPIFKDEEYFFELKIHEFGHSFIPISNEENGPFADLVTESEFLFVAIREDMERITYGTWDVALEELINRSCVIKIMEGFDPNKAATLLVRERETGFIYIDTVCASIDYYLQNRHVYNNFNEYIPELIRSLIAENRQEKQLGGSVYGLRQ